MYVARNTEELNQWREQQDKIGFIPTMGALHAGHLSLVEASLNHGLSSVASIFVNPTQFNNASDLENYPRTEGADLEALEAAGCHCVFVPSHADVYPTNFDKRQYRHHFGRLEKVLEGAFRPGHFRGVAMVVHRLFELVRPDAAFFGEKDFQQLAIIRRLVEKMEWDIDIYGMPTLREDNGLAMSSRNTRLTDHERQHAVLLYQSLKWVKSNFGSLPVETLKNHVKSNFDSDPVMSLEYIDLVDAKTLQPIRSEQKAEKRVQACIAAYAGSIRLIDNMPMNH